MNLPEALADGSSYSPRANPRCFEDVWLFLDSVEQPGNIGGIVRSAEAFGIKGVVVSRSAPPSRKRQLPKDLRHTAKGADHWVTIHQITKAEGLEWLQEKKSSGSRVVAMTPAGSPITAAYDCAPPKDSMVYIMGNEGAGVSEECLNLADAAHSIPMLGKTQSLNVCSAASVTLYEHMRSATAALAPLAPSHPGRSSH